jgi:hypothetical protein
MDDSEGRYAVPPLGLSRVREEQPLAWVMPEPQQHENEHGWGEIAKPECQAWDVRERHAGEHRDAAGERDV